MRYLVTEFGADINQTVNNNIGVTPLYVAAQEDTLEMVRCTVKELDADVNQPIQGGFTPLHITAQKVHLAALQCLVKEGGADANQAKKDQATPLFIAARNGQLAVVRSW